MSGIQVVSKSQKLILDPATQSVGVVNTGPQGPAGVPGPSEASLVLISDGQLLTRVSGELAPISRLDLAQDSAFKTVVNHGSVASTARTSSHPILWIGSVDPTNASNDDELYRTDQTAKYIRVGGSWVEIGSNRYASLSGEWIDYTPTFSGTTLGNGAVAGEYAIDANGTVTFSAVFVLGSTSAVTGSVTCTLPVTGAPQTIGQINCAFERPGFEIVGGVTDRATTDVVTYAATAGGTYVGFAALSATVPFSWGTGHKIWVSGSYQRG